MDYRICFVLSAFWMLTHGLTLQPCHNGFELTLGSVNTITCSEVKDNAVVTWRYSMGKDTTGHLAGECQGFSSSGDNSCGSALLKPKIVPHRVSQASSTLKINAGVNMEPGFVSCATPGELVKCDFDVVYPAEGVNCEAQFVVDVTNLFLRGACNVTRMMSSRHKYDCQWYSLNKESSLRKQLINVSMVTKQLADGSRKVSGSCAVSMAFPAEAGVYTFGVVITPGQVDTQAVFRGSPIVRPPAAPRITCSPKGYLREGQPLTCSCSSTSLGLPRGVLKLSKVSGNHEGLKSDVPHTSRDDGATLLMAPYNVTSEDHMSTSFHCDVMWANVVPGDTYTVQVGFPPSKPTFNVERFGAYPVREFDTLTIRCESDGRPLPQVRLRNDTTVLTNGSRLAVLTIPRVSCQDTGTYYCAAANEVEAGSVTSEAFLGVYCAPRLPGNTDHPSLVKFSGQRVQHTFDVIAYPPPRLHDITVLDLKTVRFIADKTGSDLNVTCSHTNIRLYLSSCTMDISNISLPLKASAIYKVTLANELGHVEHSVNIVNVIADDESRDTTEHYLKGLGVGIGVTIAVCLAVVAMVAAVLVVRRVLDPFTQCCMIQRDRDIFSGPRRNRNMRAEADEGFVTNLSSNTQCAKQGSCSLEDVYEVTDGYNNYTNNSLSGRPARRVLDDDDGEYISCT
ncbi:uncharacterized protein LOC112568184 [Pomacea canaliculata]|uniref:uncharacterized protein LOC112568184 n=1 Tax=Pomacea canaliculata TaxID=400727 RepID=UPI000D736D05|nr:uncharacterized protein LOC112568184 [Pomacea canaliculata]